MTLKQSVTIEETISLLNEMLKTDYEATFSLINNRVPCNKRLADHPTIQCGYDENKQFEVGLLGVINGLFGIDEKGFGAIGARYRDGKLIEFYEFKKGFSEVRYDNLDKVDIKGR